MNNVKISIVVAVYNSEKYLRECVDSLINQTISDIEIILVDDHSPDKSYEIMREYYEKYPRIIKICKTKENVRAGGARNCGLDLATGEYFGYVDADDYVDNTMYEKLYTFAKNESADCVSCLETIFDDEINRYSKCKYGSGYCCIVKRKILLSHNIRFPEKIMYEDNFFGTLVNSYVNKKLVLNENLYFSRQHVTSVRHTITKQTIFDRLDIEEMLIDAFNERNINITKDIYLQIITRYCIGTYFLFSLSKLLDTELIKGYVNRCNSLLHRIATDDVFDKNLYKYYFGFNRALLFCLQYKPLIAYYMTVFSAIVLKWIRIAKRKIQNILMKKIT